jgi:isopenicillin N synthase-like dioxygenase
MVRTIRCCNGGVAQHDKEIRQAILDDGFVYLLDYGITPDTVREIILTCWPLT